MYLLHMNVFGVKVQRNFSDECVASACDRSNNISLTDNLIAATLAREHHFFHVYNKIFCSAFCKIRQNFERYKNCNNFKFFRRNAYGEDMPWRFWRWCEGGIKIERRKEQGEWISNLWRIASHRIASHRNDGRTTTTDASATPAWRDVASPQQWRPILRSVITISRYDVH